MGIKKKHVPGNACCGVVAPLCTLCDADPVGFNVTISGIASGHACCAGINGTFLCTPIALGPGPCDWWYGEGDIFGYWCDATYAVFGVTTRLEEVDADYMRVKVYIVVTKPFPASTTQLSTIWSALVSRISTNGPVDCSAISESLTMDSYSETGLDCVETSMTVSVVSA